MDIKNHEDKIVESFENYLRIKFFNSKNSKELEKKLKNYKKTLEDKFKYKMNELNNSYKDQANYNSIISTLISEMNIDENIENEDKKDIENKDEKKDSPQKQEQKTEKEEQEHQEMSIESGAPDLENQVTLKFLISE